MKRTRSIKTIFRGSLNRLSRSNKHNKEVTRKSYRWLRGILGICLRTSKEVVLIEIVRNSIRFPCSTVRVNFKRSKVITSMSWKIRSKRVTPGAIILIKETRQLYSIAWGTILIIDLLKVKSLICSTHKWRKVQVSFFLQVGISKLTRILRVPFLSHKRQQKLKMPMQLIN